MSDPERQLLSKLVFNTDKEEVALDFEGDYKFVSSEKDRSNVLEGASVMNIFVGANNAGKSRVLRAIFRQKHFFDETVLVKIVQFASDLNRILKSNQYAPGQFPKAVKWCELVENAKSSSFWVPDASLINSMNESVQDVHKHLTDSPDFFRRNGDKSFPGKMQELLTKYSGTQKHATRISKNTDFRHRLYVPVLRGLRTLASGEDAVGDAHGGDVYSRRTTEDYFKGVELTDKTVYTGQSLYRDIRSKLLGKHGDREFIRKYEQFLQTHFFDGQSITLTPSEDSDVVSVTFNNSEVDDRSIYEYGDGVQSIICITFPLFRFMQEHPNEMLFACIEEPELYMHPSMQRKLVQVLMDELGEQVQYFVTTHSNHFLDLFSEPDYRDQISVYSVCPTEGGCKEVRRETDIADSVYDMLGARPSSLLLANKTVWVEGVSDRIYLRHALKLYFEHAGAKRPPSEDLDYAFVEYGGSNLHHYLESEQDLDINTICNFRNVFMLVDEDGTNTDTTKKIVRKKKRYDEMAKLVENGAGTFMVTAGREIENYITPDVLRMIWQDLPDNVQQDHYLSKSLPRFLKRKQCTAYISEKSGTFTNKADLARKVIERQLDFTDLSPGMQDLVKKLATFIAPTQ